MHYTSTMKTARIPPVRVEPELRAEVEALLAEGETLTDFVESSIREKVSRRRVHDEFVARGMRSLEDARTTGEYVDADTVLANLERKMEGARARLAKKTK
jgi:hypothetical protein